MSNTLVTTKTGLKIEEIIKQADPWNNVSVLFPYSITKISPKKKNKQALQKQLDLSNQVSNPLAVVVVSMIDSDGLNTLKYVLDGLMSVGLDIIMIDDEKHTGTKIFKEELKAHQDKIRLLSESAETIAKVLSAADIYLAPGKSKPLYLGQILALKYGVVPVMHQSENLDGLLEDYDPRTEAGQSFLFPFHNHWSFFAAVVRALETYKLPYDWNTIIKNGMGVEV